MNIKLNKEQLFNLLENKDKVLKNLQSDLDYLNDSKESKKNYKIIDLQKNIINIQKSYIINLLNYITNIKEED